MTFTPLYYGDKLTTINPNGDVGVVTLWSKVANTLEVLSQADINLDTSSSRIAVAANLYGNGLPHMLRNLLYNPQIQHIVICGKNLSGSAEWLVNFFREGLEEIEFLGTTAFRIKGTTRIIDGELTPENFPSHPTMYELGEIGSLEIHDRVRETFNSLPPVRTGQFFQIEPPPIPEPTITRFPSEARSHIIVRRTPMEAWQELIFRLYRFGHRNQIKKSTGIETRIELQNIHVVVEKPEEESEEVLQRFGFSLSHFREYQRKFVDSIKPADLSYTYGNRLRGYFLTADGGIVDSPVICGERLRNDHDSRHAYISLWDNSRDLPVGKGCPCFVSAFFRHFEGVLTLTATFRSHNAVDAWPENLYGLIALQRMVAGVAGIEAGPITIISHSISIDPAALARAERLVREKETDDVFNSETGKYQPRFDPNGSFTVTYDRTTWELVVEHTYEGMKLGEYRGKSAEDIERQLARDAALSIISHALYLGREIARKEREMKDEKRKSDLGT